MQFLIMAFVSFLITAIPMFFCIPWEKSCVIGIVSGLGAILLKLHLEPGPEGEGVEQCLFGIGAGAFASAKLLDELFKLIGYTC